jgi:hypothetical protein
VKCPKIDGWAVFNDCEVCKCDDSDAFASDDEALNHLTVCNACAARLGAFVATAMIAAKSYGFWTIAPVIHHPGTVTPAMLRLPGDEDE